MWKQLTLLLFCLFDQIRLQAHTDAVIIGAEPIVLNRTLTPDGWRFFHHITETFNSSSEIVKIEREGGSTLTYQRGKNLLHFLQSEKLPNGNNILYTYDPYFRLKLIQTTDPSHTKVYAYARIHYASRSSGNPNFTIETSDGKELTYLFDTHLNLQSIRTFSKEYNETWTTPVDPTEPPCDNAPITQHVGTSQGLMTYTLREEPPFLGMISTISESALDPTTHQKIPVRKIALTYSPSGHIVKQAVFDATDTWRYTLETDTDAKGRITRQTNPLGQAELFCYDEKGRLASHTPFHGQFKTEYTWSENDRLIAATHYASDGTTQSAPLTLPHPHLQLPPLKERKENGPLIEYEYDALGRETKTIHHHPPFIEHKEDDLADRVIAEWTEDSEGNPLLKKTFTYDAAGNTTHTTRYIEGRPCTTIDVYDPWGERIEQIDPCGNITTFNGHAKPLAPSPEELLPEAPPLNRIYDPHGNLIQETFPQGHTIRRTCDPYGHRTELTLPDGGIARYTFNPLFPIKVERFASDGAPLYTHTFDIYDLSGNCLEETYLNGMKAQTSFDNNGRVHAQKIEGILNQTAQYTNQGTIHTLHTATPFSEETAHLEMDPLVRTYDPHDRPIEETLPGHWRYLHTYDSLSRKASTTTYTWNNEIWQKDQTFTYLYDDKTPLATCDETGKILELTLPGLIHPIALEKGEKIFIPITDITGKRVAILDPLTNHLHFSPHAA